MHMDSSCIKGTRFRFNLNRRRFDPDCCSGFVLTVLTFCKLKPLSAAQMGIVSQLHFQADSAVEIKSDNSCVFEFWELSALLTNNAMKAQILI